MMHHHICDSVFICSCIIEVCVGPRVVYHYNTIIDASAGLKVRQGIFNSFDFNGFRSN